MYLVLFSFIMVNNLSWFSGTYFRRWRNSGLTAPAHGVRQVTFVVTKVQLAWQLLQSRAICSRALYCAKYTQTTRHAGKCATQNRMAWHTRISSRPHSSVTGSQKFVEWSLFIQIYGIDSFGFYVTVLCDFGDCVIGWLGHTYSVDYDWQTLERQWCKLPWLLVPVLL